jgi:hypothetical protein
VISTALDHLWWGVVLGSDQITVSTVISTVLDQRVVALPRARAGRQPGCCASAAGFGAARWTVR